MIVSRLDKNHDWTFGQSLANYARDSEAIAQNVATRLLSWKHDWFLDVEAEIDWRMLLGERNTKQRITDEILRVVRNTEGVVEVVSIDVTVSVLNRHATWFVEYNDVFNENRTITNEA